MDRKFDVVNVYLFTLAEKRRNLVTMFDKPSILLCAVAICLIFGETGVAASDTKVKKMRKATNEVTLGRSFNVFSVANSIA